ncbi:MAG: NADH-quinone oxidoreductase subunit C [Aminipila sp.]
MGEQNIRKISSDEILAETITLKGAGYRLVAISCTNKEGLELSYSFDKDYDFINLRINMDYDTEIESISCIYNYAFLYENEIAELFGAKIKNIAVDFKDKLYRLSVETPFNMKKEEE